MDERLRSFLLVGIGLVVGLAVGVLLGVLLGTLTAGAGSPVGGTTVPSHGVSTVTGCAGDEPRAWVATTPDSDHRSVYLANYSFTHDSPGVDVRSTLREGDDGAWTLALATTPSETDREVPADCRPRTTVDATVALPTGADSLTITLDGEPLATVEVATNRPRFRYLEE
ncbi:hypothetical protein JCM30237_28060 [Halolamina litorea]|uniref:Uncharacterized protein n=1 Tax=Halolamina litorea TaxID=1515593 RepID=A0ABD6BSW9_9EURY|nr:hypothetical protein [Halolamina litorea]